MKGVNINGKNTIIPARDLKKGDAAGCRGKRA